MLHKTKRPGRQIAADPNRVPCGGRPPCGSNHSHLDSVTRDSNRKVDLRLTAATHDGGLNDISCCELSFDDSLGGRPLCLGDLASKTGHMPFDTSYFYCTHEHIEIRVF